MDIDEKFGINSLKSVIKVFNRHQYNPKVSMGW